MKKVEKRALMCLLLGLVLLAGLCFFIYEDWHDGGKWAVYKGNRDVFADGSLAKGALYDRDGALLMRNTSDGMVGMRLQMMQRKRGTAGGLMQGPYMRKTNASVLLNDTYAEA